MNPIDKYIYNFVQIHLCTYMFAPNEPNSYHNNHAKCNSASLPLQKKHFLLFLNQHASFVDSQTLGLMYLHLLSNPISPQSLIINARTKKKKKEVQI